jgi:hypothetical protein
MKRKVGSRVELQVHSNITAYLQSKFAPRFVRRRRKVWIATRWQSFWLPWSVQLRWCWTEQPRPSPRRLPPILLRLPTNSRRTWFLELEPV